MSTESLFEIYAVRYAHHDRNASANFIGGDPHDEAMPLDYFVWAVVGPHKTYLVDTGFDRAASLARGRQLLRPVAEGLEAIGIDHATVSDIIISHMHYDHAGNRDLFPAATYHLQDEEMAYCTGRCMSHGIFSHAFDPADIQSMVGKLFDKRVRFHDGESEIEPGLTVHRVGGHTRGLQVVRVKTRRGWVVLGSDAAHFYANFEQYRPFPVVDNVAQMVAGYDRMRALATSERHIVPGHDPLVLQRYPRARADIADIVRLDESPADY
jgi:glyoxylase-like metal-dependent hydrolase (beta-lactamase superfamily II)